MTTFNYSRPAELFSGHVGGGKGRPMTYRRFATAAAAIRFAIESLPAAALAATVIEIEDDRLDGRQIREYYDSDAYPLKRARPA